RTRPPQTKLCNDRFLQATPLQVLRSRRRRRQQAHIMRLSRIKYLLLTRDFCLALLRSSPLPGTLFLFRNRHSDSAGQRPHSLREACPCMLGQESNGSTMRTAAKAVIRLFGWTDSEGWRFFVMKRTEAKQVDPTRFQLHVFANNR